MRDWKLRVAAIVATLLLSTGLAAPPQTARAVENQITSVNVSGFEVSWDAVMYLPTGCSRYEFRYSNNVGRRLLKVGFELNSVYGDSIARDSLIGAPSGGSGVWSEQICKDKLPTTGPYLMKVYIEDYSSNGGNTAQQTVDLYFTDRNSSTPTPGTSPNPSLGHLQGHGPDDGEFSAWTKVLEGGKQMKFYAKYLQLGQKVQFMVQNSRGVYEQVAWQRVSMADLGTQGEYTTLQNHVYFIRTIDLKPGKNRVRILVDGKVVWGTKTYSR